MLQDSIIEERVKIFGEDYIPPDMKLVVDLKELIEQCYKEYRDPQYYVDCLSVTLAVMNPICKAYLNKTVYGLILDRIVKEAKKLLTYTRMSSRQIAFELGFRDPNYFSRFFLRETGVRPRNYRKHFSGM